MTVLVSRPPAVTVAHHRDAERGSALLSVILISLLVSALLAGFMSMVMADQRAGYSNRDQTTAYAAAHAGLEQLTADLGELFATNFRPTAAQVNAIMGTPPDVGGSIAYQQPGGAVGSGYRITFTDANGDGFPDTEECPSEPCRDTDGDGVGPAPLPLDDPAHGATDDALRCQHIVVQSVATNDNVRRSRCSQDRRTPVRIMRNPHQRASRPRITMLPALAVRCRQSNMRPNHHRDGGTERGEAVERVKHQ